jgi:heat shock protein HslJ
VNWSTLSCLGVLAALVLTLGSPAPVVCELVGPYWQAVEIDGSPVPIVQSKQEPFLIFTTAGRVSGSTGCNRFTGSYQQDGNGFHFTPLAVTKMACPPPLDALERSFLQAMAATAALRQSGNAVELLDTAGQVRLRLQAR